MKPYLLLSALAFICLELSLPLPFQYIVAAGALIVMGLPHGAFDIALEHQSRREMGLPPVATRDMIALYLAIAGVMAGLWVLLPALALVVFLGLAIAHFSTDFDHGLDPWIARASTIAILTAPVLWHRRDLAALFGSLAGVSAGDAFADAALMLAPLALAMATAGVAMLVAGAYYRDAARLVIVIALMIVLNPVIAFTAYFCFDHAPRYLAIVNGRLPRSSSAFAGRQAFGFTLLSVVGAVLLALMLPDQRLSEASVRAAFITLSVLTLPHMTMPWILAVTARRVRAARQMPILAR